MYHGMFVVRMGFFICGNYQTETEEQNMNKQEQTTTNKTPMELIEFIQLYLNAPADIRQKVDQKLKEFETEGDTVCK